MKARVHNGRFVIDEPTDLPEGTEVSLVIDDGGDELDDEERARLHAALDQAARELEAGLAVPAE